MPRKFEIAKDVMVPATPEQVWEAISTGPGTESWFLGKSEIEPRKGGKVRWSIGDYTENATVTTWDPPNHFVSTGDESPAGTLHQFDYRIEDRGGGRTAVRYVHSGMLGEDWEAEYEAMQEGDPMYLDKLVVYLTYFQGRFAKGIDAFGPRVEDREQVMATYKSALGMPDDVAVGDKVRLTPDGMEPIDGVVDYVSPHFIGVRSSDAIYRFIHSFEGSTMVGHHLFAEGVDRAQAEGAWASWLNRVFGAPA